MKKSKSFFTPIGEDRKPITVESYPIPQRPSAANPNSNLKVTSFYKTDTGLAAGVMRQWAPINNRPLQSSIILYRIDLQAIKLNTSVAYSVLSKLVANLNFNTTQLSALPANNLSNQTFTQITFMGPPDNTQISWEGPLKIEPNSNMTFSVDAYATISAGDSIIWTAQFYWTPAI